MLPTFQVFLGAPRGCSIGICIQFCCFPSSLCVHDVQFPRFPAWAPCNLGVWAKALSHGAVRAANLKGAKWLVPFYLGNKASQVSLSPCENSSFFQLSGRVQTRVPRGQTGPFWNWYLRQMCFFFFSRLLPFPTFYSPPALPHSFCFNVSE